MAPNPVQALRSFIPPGSALGRAGGADMLLRVTGGNVSGAAALASIAKAESSFGDNTGRFTNNPYGYGVHAGPSVYTAPSIEAMTERVWKSLNSSLYKGAGYRTLPKIITRYVTGADGNDMGAYTRNTSSWVKSLGLDPNADIFSGAATTSAPAAPSAGRAPGASPAAARPGASSTPDAQAGLAMAAIQAINEIGQPGGISPATLIGLSDAKRLADTPAASSAPQAARNAIDKARAEPVQAVRGGRRLGTPFGTTFTLPGLPGEVAPAKASSSITNPKGQVVATSTFDGKPVSQWWASMLSFARSKGWKGTVNSGYRSVSEQRQIWNRHPDPTWVARPGSSPHQYAMAVDISDGPGLEAIIRKYKLPIARYAPEGWHFEPLGFRTNGSQRTFW